MTDEHVTFAKVVADAEAGNFRAEPATHRVQRQQFEKNVAQCLAARVGAAKRDLRLRVAQDARGDRMAFGMIAVEQTVRRPALYHLRKFPAEIDGILQAEVETLPAKRRMDVCGVAGEQHADRKSTRLNSSHVKISYAVFCLKKKKA